MLSSNYENIRYLLQVRLEPILLSTLFATSENMLYYTANTNRQIQIYL